MFIFEDIRVVRGGNEILRGVGGAFRSGAMHAVVGPSGCGKTTLLRALIGMIPFEGQVNGGGGGRVGFVPQFSVAHSRLTVREVLEFTARLALTDREARMTETAAASALVGLDHLLGNEVRALSGGQMRRLGLAMELVRGPEILFCDEVTSGLDPRAEKEILAILRRLVREKGITVVCVIHNLGRLDDFDTATVLREGEVRFAGETERLKGFLGGRAWEELYEVLFSEGEVIGVATDATERKAESPDVDHYGDIIGVAADAPGFCSFLP